MPADDQILTLKQIAGYPPVSLVPPSASLILQTNGLGSPYMSISAAALVSTALANAPGDLYVAGRVAAGSMFSPCVNFGTLSAQKAVVAGVPVANKEDIAAILTNSVFSFNMRFGHVMLERNDILCAGGAPIWSPRFRGEPRAITPQAWSNNTRLATTEFVHRNSVLYINDLLSTHPFVFTFNGRTGDVVLTPEDLAGAEAALLDSPIFTGNPTAPTPAPGDNSQSLSTTSFVTNAIAASEAAQGVLNAQTYAPLTNPSFVGQPSAPTAPPGTNTGQLATTAYVMAAVAASTAGVASFNGRTGVVDLEAADLTSAGGALLESPNFTGTPQAPTAPPGSTSSQIATCAWVANEIGSSTVGVMSFNGREGVVTLNTSDITGAGGAPAASPVFTGNPQAPTATTGTNTTQLATCAFVAQAIMANGVASFNGRTGNVTLAANDISAAGGLINPSVALTGTPTAPTATGGTNTTQIATTAFVMQAISGASVVASFNGRNGAVSLTSGDVNAAGAGGPYATSAALTAATTPLSITQGSFMSVEASTGQSFPASQNILINFDTVEYDTNGEFSPTTHLFTAKRTGYYRVSGYVFIYANTTGSTMSVLIIKNGTAGAYGNLFYQAIGTSGNCLVFNSILHLTTGDAVGIYGFTGAGGGGISVPDPSYNRFQVQLLALG